MRAGTTVCFNSKVKNSKFEKRMGREKWKSIIETTLGRLATRGNKEIR